MPLLDHLRVSLENAAMILAVDVGTSSVKAGLFDLGGAMVAREEVPIALRSSAAAEGYEIDPALWLKAFKWLAGRLAASRSGRIRSVVLSGNGPTLVAADQAGRALHPAITWMDARGAEKAARLLAAGSKYQARRRAAGDRATREKGVPGVDPSFYLAKAHWLADRKPGVYERTRWFLPCPEYVAFALTGEAAAVLPAAGFRRLMWSEEAIGALGLDPGRFPPFAELGAEVGRIGSPRAEESGLEAGTPVRLAGPDFLMSLLGTATLQPGDTCDRAGSSEGINRCSEAACGDRRLITLPHVAEGLFNVSGLISTSGKAQDWFINLMGSNREQYYESIRTVPAGSRNLLFLPSLAGERAPLWNPEARGVFAGLTLSHGMAELGRAVAESVGYAMRYILEIMGENGIPVGEMRVAGNLARNEVLNQIKADITGRRLLVPRETDAELLGDACVGLAASGVFGSAVEAARTCVRIEREYLPRSERGALYTRMFGLYKELYERLEPSFSATAAWRRGDAG